MTAPGQHDFEPPYEIIVRACDGRDGATCQLGLGDSSKWPDDETSASLRATAAKMFEEQFGHVPSRVGVAVLPWVEEDER